MLRRLPLLRGQVDTIRDLTGAGADLGTTARQAAGRIQAALDIAKRQPAGRVQLLDTVAREADGLRRAVRAVSIPDRSGVLPPASSARASFERRLGRTEDRLLEVRERSALLRALLAGPSRYLVLAGNNSEMRAGGMVLSAGVVEFRDGDFRMGRLFQTSNLRLLDGPVSLHPQHRRIYESVGIGQEWRGTNTSPHFRGIAPLYAEMSRRTRLGPVDGVLYADVVALRELLAVTGPVTVQGKRYSDRNVVREVLNENYLRFGTIDPLTQRARVDIQGQLARAVIGALNRPSIMPGKLAAAVERAATGRRLMIWSVNPELARLWFEVGVDGNLDRNGLMVTVQNVSANKLDWFLRPRVRLHTRWVREGRRRVDLMVTVTNPRRRETSATIENDAYHRHISLPAGDHNAWFLTYLPASASDISASPVEIHERGRDGPMRVAGFRSTLRYGKTHSFTVSFTLPADLRPKLLPSGRPRPVPVQTDWKRYTDARPVALIL